MYSKPTWSELKVAEIWVGVGEEQVGWRLGEKNEYRLPLKRRRSPAEMFFFFFFLKRKRGYMIKQQQKGGQPNNKA